MSRSRWFRRSRTVRRVIDAQKKTGRVLQVGSQRVSSIVYQKAKDLLKAGAIGQVNMIEAWWDRNSAIGAWQYSIPPDASPPTIDWDRFLGSAPKGPFEPIRLFRWRNYRDYGTGVAGDLFVHLFSGMHFIMDRSGSDTRILDRRTAVLEGWPRCSRHHARTLRLPADRKPSGIQSGVASEFRQRCQARPTDSASLEVKELLSIGNGVTVSKQPRESEPGYTIDTFPKAVQEAVPEGISREVSSAARAPLTPSAPRRRNVQPATRVQRSSRTSPRLYGIGAIAQARRRRFDVRPTRRRAGASFPDELL